MDYVAYYRNTREHPWVFLSGRSKSGENTSRPFEMPAKGEY